MSCSCPIGAEDSFAGVVDLVRMKAITWDGEELGAKFKYEEIPADLKEKADEYRAALVELVVDQVGPPTDAVEKPIGSLMQCRQ